VGTVDGAFYSLDGGTSWISFSSLDNLSIQTLTFDYPLAGSTHYLFMGTKTHGISRITLFH
jgi:hypothetical protein